MWLGVMTAASCAGDVLKVGDFDNCARAEPAARQDLDFMERTI